MTLSAHRAAQRVGDPRYPAVTDVVELDDRYEVHVNPPIDANCGQQTALVSGIVDIHRQAIEGLARVHLNVADDDHLVLRSVHYRRSPELPRAVGERYSRVRVDVPRALIRRREPGKCYAFGGEISSWTDTAMLACGGGKGAFISSDSYENLRSTNDPRHWGLPAPAGAATDPALLGLQRRDVLIGEVTYSDSDVRSVVVADDAHRYFDRPLDHYPGLMLAGAARQLAMLATSHWTGVPVAEIEVQSEAHDFLAFVELGTPPTLDTRRVDLTGNRIRLLIQVSQFGSLRATCLFILRAGRPLRAT